MNFIPMALSEIPKAFNLSELAKRYFPHLFNKCENQKIILNRLPDINYYNPGGMMPKDHHKFMEWHDEHQHDRFHFEEEIIKYCRSDVDVLRRGCLKFIFMQMTSRNDEEGIDPFAHCITIASVCNLVFRKFFLEEQSIGNIPGTSTHKGIDQRTNSPQSHAVDKIPCSASKYRGPTWRK